MESESLLILKEPNVASRRDRLERTGLALEYFEGFEQEDHAYHSHAFIEMLYVIRGSFRHIMADETYDETDGSLTILNYRQFHSLKTQNGPVELMNIYLDPQRYPFPDLPAPLSGRLYSLIPLHPELGNRLNRIQHLQLPDPGKAAVILRLLHGEQDSGSPGAEKAMEDLFSLFLIELCRAAPAVERDSNDLRMDRVIKYLESHYTEPVRLTELCELSGLREANLCRHFREYTGMSTGDYLKQRRLAAALQKLRTTDDKILSVCYESGFPDISRFNRTFREAFGCTPSEYRKKNRGA